MDWTGILAEGLTGSFDILIRMFLVLVPLIIAMEMLRESGWLERLSNKLSFVARIFSSPKEATFPLLIGGLFGLTYGGGALLEHRQENTLSEKENRQVAEIVGISHGWIEDTMLFTIVGANFFIVLFTRLITAIIFARLLSLKEQFF